MVEITSKAINAEEKEETFDLKAKLDKIEAKRKKDSERFAIGYCAPRMN